MRAYLLRRATATPPLPTAPRTTMRRQQSTSTATKAASQPQLKYLFPSFYPRRCVHGFVAGYSRAVARSPPPTIAWLCTLALPYYEPIQSLGDDSEENLIIICVAG